MARSGHLICTFLVLLIAGHSVWASAPTDDVDEKDVVVLTTNNFETELAKQKFALVRRWYLPSFAVGTRRSHACLPTLLAEGHCIDLTQTPNTLH